MVSMGVKVNTVNSGYIWNLRITLALSIRLHLDFEQLYLLCSNESHVLLGQYNTRLCRLIVMMYRLHFPFHLSNLSRDVRSCFQEGCIKTVMLELLCFLLTVMSSKKLS